MRVPPLESPRTTWTIDPLGSHRLLLTLAKRIMIDSAEEFKSLRESENPEEYSKAAQDEAPLEVWHEVIERFPEMRFWAAQNKTIPIEILEIIASDDDPKVRSMVAQKRKINKRIKEMLVIDPDASVRARLAYNAKIEEEYLLRLRNDSESFVREAAQNTLTLRANQA